MSKIKKITYSLKDVLIVPAEESHIEHRGEDTYPFTSICGREEVYPIFVAPMEGVTDERNYKTWLNSKVTPVIPRSVMDRISFEERLSLSKETFVSFSLSEAEMLLYKENKNITDKMYICVDLANGHMHKLLMLCKDLKKKYGENIEIMTGNIANPKVYKKLCKHGISWVRAGIGGGSRCTTSNTTGVGYGLATLLDELCEEKNKFLSKYPDFEDNYTKIVADGGINWYDDICKALALGADAVMMGKMFAECNEACGTILYCKSEEDFNLDIGFFEDELYNISPELRDELMPYRNYVGMSQLVKI